jgi:ferric-dicitrate binding protein FerR (iron transport regulator)
MSRLHEHVRARDNLVTAWIEDEVLLYGTPIRDLVETLR